MEAILRGQSLIEEYVGTTRCIVLGKASRIPDRTDERVEYRRDTYRVGLPPSCKSLDPLHHGFTSAALPVRNT